MKRVTITIVSPFTYGAYVSESTAEETNIKTRLTIKDGLITKATK